MVDHYMTVIGGVNMDISAALTASFVPADSVPGQVTLGCGGVARNIAHNLRLMGSDVKFITLFGGETFGEMCRRECQAIGLNIDMSERCEGLRNGLYLCVNDQSGDMIAAVADTDIMNHITPDFLQTRLEAINGAAAVVADTNIPTDSLLFLIDHCRAPLFVDAVSTAKAPRAITALQQSRARRFHALKLNLKEARAVTGCDNAPDAAASLIDMGVEQVYITMGGDGVYCANATHRGHYPAIPARVVNTTGAGDAFIAGIAHATVLNVPFPDGVQVGIKAAHATLLTGQTVNPDIAQYLK